MSKKKNRKMEILDATKKLYEVKNYSEINIKEVSKLTSMSRPSIYNYFETKEEIFLHMLEVQYLNWNEELKQSAEVTLLQNRENLILILTKSLYQKDLMFKLISNNIKDLEENSRFENIVNFKRAYGKTLETVNNLVKDFMVDWTKEDCTNFLYAFFPFLYGIYPYTNPTEIQKKAMIEAKVPFHFFTRYDLIYNFLSKIITDTNESRQDE